MNGFTKVLEVPIGGQALLDCPLLNKGSAFSESERHDLGLLGLLPSKVSSLEEQATRRYEEYRQLTTDLDRYVFLRALQDRNETLFYRLLQDHITEMMPIIYTPVVGEVCQRYSNMFHRPRGLYVSYPERHEIDAILANRPNSEIDVIVVTDGERILGLGDQGVGGMGIPEGKLALYTLCGGVHPGRTLPVLLDVGTDNAERLQDPHYLGWPQRRVRGAEYEAFIEDFVQAVLRQLPGVLLQWEDFAHVNARKLLDRYRDRLCTFNDDIQGTAAVTVSALLAAVRITGSKLSEQRVVFVGAGAAATGIGDLIVAALAEEGIAENEARSRLWLLNSRGLLHEGMERLEPWQLPYRQPAARIAGWQRDSAGNVPLPVVVEKVRPTVLIGVSGQPGTFTQEVVRSMAKHTKRPIIFPLSNPTSRSEGLPSNMVAWTEGRALIATGSPFPAVPYEGAARFRSANAITRMSFPGWALA